METSYWQEFAVAAILVVAGLSMARQVILAFQGKGSCGCDKGCAAQKEPSLVSITMAAPGQKVQLSETINQSKNM